MSATRLSSLDASFLRLESGSTHMHVAWRGRFRPAARGERPTVARLRRSVSGRLRYAPRFRQRLAFPPAGLGEPFWVDDTEFDVDFHVRRLGDPYEPLATTEFERLADGVLSEPLDRTRPLWEVHLAPRLADGGTGLVMKMHHAMVDGMSAVALALLVFAASPDVRDEEPDEWRAETAPSDAALALRALRDGTSESLRAARGIAGLAQSPVSSGGRLASTLRRAALAVGEDFVRSAPAACVNRRIGPRRTLVGCELPLARVVTLKRRLEATHNDICLALVSGAMRELALAAGDAPAPMKAMVPVSMRAAAEAGMPGNRISFAFVDLPLDLAAPRARLRSVHEQTAAFKSSARAAGTESLLDALRFAPSPVKTYVARLAGSARLYNLTVSNVPGPRTPIYMLGAELVEAYPVVPLSQDHALSIGIFTHADSIFFGLYADPEALPEVRMLPRLLAEAMAELDFATRPRSRPARSASVPRPAPEVAARG
ncbi:MAG: wax ester/triacylglycerol synthase family O-acyltransferase [Solirubrobacteraceae bacterium]